MAIQNWSEEITVVELANDPLFSDEMTSLMDQLEAEPRDVVINFTGVDFINSSNIARLLQLRKLMLGVKRRLVLCGVNSQVWGIFLITRLDKIFELTDDVATALTTVQLAGERE